jgi:hypothetical protein
MLADVLLSLQCARDVVTSQSIISDPLFPCAYRIPCVKGLQSRMP